MKTPSIIEFVTDSQLLGLTLSFAQEVLLRAIYGLPLAPDQLDVWRRCTGRTVYLSQPFGEVVPICGARAGKDSRIAVPVALYEAVFGGHEKHLAKGEAAIIPIVAPNARLTKVAFGYAKDYLARSPLLAGMVAEVLASEIALTNRVTLSCFPCTMKGLRGWSIPCGILDELSFFRLEGQADSDAEVQASIRRGMLSFPSPRLVKISTPYMKSGVLYEDFKRAWGKDDADTLVWKASSMLMNPSIRAERMDRERRLDPLRFAREYEAEFAEDLESFLPAAWVEDAVLPACHERPPAEGVQYVAAVDPSGGGSDAFTFAVVHGDGSAVVQDVMRSWSRRGSQTLDLTGVVKEIAAILGRYHLREVVGDAYGGSWVQQAFQAEGVGYRKSDLDKAAAYLECEPLFAQGHVKLLDHPALLRELKMLERRPRVGGRTVVDHPSGQHDDHANAALLAVAHVANRGPCPICGKAGCGRFHVWGGGPIAGGSRLAQADQARAEGEAERATRAKAERERLEQAEAEEEAERRADAAYRVSSSVARGGLYWPGE